MGAVLNYRDFTKPAEKWANMERFRLLMADIDPQDKQTAAIARVMAFPEANVADHSPCEFYPGDAMYSAPEKDPA
jgi:hypothetical protein